MTKGSKDSLVSYLASKILSNKLEEYVERIVFSIDSDSKKIGCEFLLKGENDAVKVEINRYSLSSVKGKTYITLHEIRTSRVWLNVLIERHFSRLFPERRIEVPADYARLARFLL
jgi:hypothetical protein